MTNHIHLLLTPLAPTRISRLMQAVNTAYVQMINQRFRRTGHLWSGRFKSGLVEFDHYLLTCMHYIELNPVRAGMVVVPEHYRWSSFHHNALGCWHSLITPHEVYKALGETPAECCAHYREIVQEPLEETCIGGLRQVKDQGVVFGGEHFRTQIRAMLGRNVVIRKRGRPPKQR